MNRKHVIGGLFWLAVSIFVAVNAIALEIGTFSKPGAGFIFFWSSLGLGTLSIILIIKSILGTRESTPSMDLWKNMKWGNAVLVVGMLLLYALILTKLGFMLSTFLLMIVLFGIGRSTYRVVIVSALIATILSFVIFRYFLEVLLPRGIIGW
jgi:putative tricarboxylic transport membrane protein